MLWLVAEVALTLPLATPARCDAPVNISFDQDFDPFYQEQVHALLRQAEAIIPQAYNRITKAWHLDYQGLRHPLLVQFKETPSQTLRRLEVAYLQTDGAGDQIRFTLVVDLGAYLQDPTEDLHVILTHEMAHAILHDYVLGPKASAIPTWFDEGMAQSVTRQGQDQVRQDAKELRASGRPLFLCDLTAPVDEFAHGPFNFGCYSEYYLAVQRLLHLGGPKALDKILPGLRDGKPLVDLIHEITKLDWASFQKDAARYTETVLTASR